jgi:hypothetical protein
MVVQVLLAMPDHFARFFVFDVFVVEMLNAIEHSVNRVPAALAVMKLIAYYRFEQWFSLPSLARTRPSLGETFRLDFVGY